MTEIDLDRLGDVWRGQPDPAELEALQRTAAAVSRRARWAQLVDMFGALVVAAAVIVLVLRNPELDTLLMGGGAIVVLLASQARQRRLRAAEIRSLSGDTEAMLDQSIERVQATRKRNRFGLLGLAVGIPLGLLISLMVKSRTGGVLLPMLDDSGLRLLVIAAGAVLMLGVAVHFALSARRARREGDRLIAMRDDYRRERESSVAE